jgi:hypothetical protein
MTDIITDSKTYKRKVLSFHYAKTEDRLKFEADHDCYLMIVESSIIKHKFTI